MNTNQRKTLRLRRNVCCVQNDDALSENSKTKSMQLLRKKKHPQQFCLEWRKHFFTRSTKVLFWDWIPSTSKPSYVQCNSSWMTSLTLHLLWRHHAFFLGVFFCVLLGFFPVAIFTSTSSSDSSGGCACPSTSSSAILQTQNYHEKTYNSRRKHHRQTNEARRSIKFTLWHTDTVFNLRKTRRIHVLIYDYRL